MAAGTCPAAPHLSALDPSVGKTQAVIHFLRTLMASDHHRHVGVLVCVQRLEQIRCIIDEAGLRQEDFGVFTSDLDTNAYGQGCQDPSKARVVFTTHAMVERRVAQRLSFVEVKAFHFRGRARTRAGGKRKPIRAKFRAIKLADWSDEKRPKVCNF